MSESKEPPSCARPNRRKEIFRVVRGSKLTGQRGTRSAEPDNGAIAGAGISVLQELPSMRRARLGALVEDEAGDANLPVRGRYSEPND
jgi:hypothetical protein